MTVFTVISFSAIQKLPDKVLKMYDLVI